MIKDFEDSFEKLADLIKNHDWEYDRDPDHPAFEVGYKQRREILLLARTVPMYKLYSLFSHVPSNRLASFKTEIFFNFSEIGKTK